jgi:gamma-carbonic anhydrase
VGTGRVRALAAALEAAMAIHGSSSVEDGRRRHCSASPYEVKVGFCRAQRVGGRILVSGSAPIGDDGKTVAPGDPVAQTRRCVEVVGRAVEALGGRLEDVVRTRVYLTRREDWELVGQAHGEAFAATRPASTFVVVAGLLDPEWLVEVEAEAVAPFSAEPIVRPFGGRTPVLDEGAWLAPGAVVVGDVAVGPDTSLWYGAVVRGDTNYVRIGARTNIQDLAVVHTTRDTTPTTIGDDVTVGHQATLHACTVEDGALVGIGARVLDGGVIGEEAVLAAGSLVPPGATIPPRVLALGSPARVRRELSSEELAYNRETNANYVKLAALHRAEDR